MNMRKGKKSHPTSVIPLPSSNTPKSHSSTYRTFTQLRSNHDYPVQSSYTTDKVQPVVGDDDVKFVSRPKYDNKRQATTLPVARVDEVKSEENKLFAPIPASLTEQPKAKKKKKTAGPITIAELVKQTEQERLDLRGLEAKPQASVSSSSASFTFHSPKAKANGYNARKQSNLAQIAVLEGTPRRKR